MTIMPPPPLWDTARTIDGNFRIQLDCQPPVIAMIARATLDAHLASWTDDLVALAFENRDTVERALANAWMRQPATTGEAATHPRILVVATVDFR